MDKLSKNSPGQVLILVLVIVMVMMAISAILVASVFQYAQNGRLAYAQERALQLAEAGIDKAVYEVNQPGGMGYAGEANITLGDGMYTVVIADVGAKKIIESTGYIPNSANPVAQKKVKIELATTSAGVAFFYGVQVGYGGLHMNNNAVVEGSVYSDGTVTGANGARVSGDVWVAGGVAAAPDQQQVVQSAQQNIGDVAVSTDGAQSFIAGETQVISRVSLLLKKEGNPSNATVRIVTDNGGNPSNTVLAAGTLNSSSVGSSFGWIDVSLLSNPQLNSGQKYWLVIDVSSPQSSRYYIWAKHTNSGYGNGVGMLSSNWAGSPPLWTDANGDFGFKTWMGGGATSLQTLALGGDAHANTILDSTIGRDAYYQTLTNSSVAGTSYPGSADPPTIDMPVSESVISDFKALAAAGGVITPPSGTYLIDGTTETMGPVKIAGNLILINGAVLTITGPIWVEGDITLSNNSMIKLHTDFGSDSTMIIADYPADPYSKGKISVLNNGQVYGSGDPNSYIMLLSTYANPVGYAIDVNNNTSGAIFYASAGTIQVANNVLIKEVIAYRLSLANNASVRYESGLANTNFTSGPSGGWLIKRGTWQLVKP